MEQYVFASLLFFNTSMQMFIHLFVKAFLKSQ